ncbi:hypothetical protein B0T26DRAFT_706098 [Lasiosphaeria miniovina]|uniref:Uncharacterized protein n=1 Tax=Lasiosphaeria miniovina TaxID=1954250 RepID=A0AA40E5K9_9PEZI|nr:uncharacterized protein B0T26DRAFT_706098 [Lasiosphaeria miniovina]KAK0723303.1 hypothetical protein B0T26DRAFT_706098 [Lasiosphaeria miniovina]
MASDEKTLQNFVQENPATQDHQAAMDRLLGHSPRRFVPVARCLRIAQGEEEYLLPQVSMIIPVSTAPQCFPTGNDVEIWVLRPDWSSLRRCGFRPSHASVMCFLEHKGAYDGYSKCPRMLLSRTLHRLGRERGTKALAGFEIKCMLLDQDSQPLNQLDRLNSYQKTAVLARTWTSSTRSSTTSPCRASGSSTLTPRPTTRSNSPSAPSHRWPPSTRSS